MIVAHFSINREIDELLNCVIVITSRPDVSGHLHDSVDCRVEILGFADEIRKEYIEKVLDNDENKVKMLLGYLEKNPAINAYCYIPLNMNILLYLIYLRN